MLSLNRKHLERQGYEVLCAETLASARNILWETPPDLIVLDVLMPDGSGFDFCEEIRRLTTAPVLYLTCMDKDENIVRGLSGGGDDYLTKPYSLEVLFARIMAQLRRNGFANVGRIELPPLTVDLLSGRAALDGREIALSRKELQLLACLANNMGRTFTTDELYEAVWGEPADQASANTVYAHISTLRRKLGLGDNSPFELRSCHSGAYTLVKVRYAAEA